MTVIINGSNTPTAGGVTYGDGTQYATTSAGTSGQVLISAGASAPTWGAINAATGITGTLPIANGGTGTTSTTFANLATNVTGTLPIANGGTNSTATPTAGGVGYGTGTAHAYTSAGTSGQVLTSAGASAPTWTTPSSGALVLLSTQTLSSQANPVFTTGISSTYKVYKLYAQVYGTSNTTIQPFLRFYANGSVDSASTAYNYRYLGNTGTYTTGSSANAIQIMNAAYGQSIPNAWALEITIYAEYSQSTPYPAEVSVTGTAVNGTLLVNSVGGYLGTNGANAAITGIQFNTGGTTVNGSVSFYGVTP